MSGPARRALVMLVMALGVHACETPAAHKPHPDLVASHASRLGSPPTIRPPATAGTLEYRPYFDALLARNRQTWNTQTATSAGWSPRGSFDLYASETILMGVLSMFEATQRLAAQGIGTAETRYLDIALSWIENWTRRGTYVPLAGKTTPSDIAAASRDKFIVDSNGDRNWSGGWNLAGTGATAPAPVCYELHELQGMVQMARAVRIIRTDPALNATYGARASAIGDLVHHMLVKQLVHRRNEARWLAAYVDNGAGYTDDKPLQLLAVVVNMHGAGYAEFRPGRTYRSLAEHWLGLILGNKTSSPDFRAPCSGDGCPGPVESISAAGASILDFNTLSHPRECGPDPAPCSWDTSHYNRWPKLLVYAYDAGIAVRSPHIQQAARLLTRIIWDGSTTVPRFRNRTDGRNSVHRKVRRPWENGSIHDGWVELGGFDAEALAAAEAMMNCIVSGCGSPSVKYYSGDAGRMNLAGGVTLARVRSWLTQKMKSESGLERIRPWRSPRRTRNA